MARDKSAQKRAARKASGYGQGRGKGVRDPALHDPSPKERAKRFHIPAFPVKDAFSPMAAPTQRIATLVRVELVRTAQKPSGFARTPDLKQPHEYCTVRAHLSDGRVINRRGKMEYAPQERERILEAVVDGTGSERDVHGMTAILNRRARLVEALFGQLQREYGKGVPWQTS